VRFATIDCAVDIKAVKSAELERVIVDSTVQSKAIAHPVDSRLVEISRYKVVAAAKRVGIALKQTCAQEGSRGRPAGLMPPPNSPSNAPARSTPATRLGGFAS
jgi:hypothetical protein